MVSPRQTSIIVHLLYKSTFIQIFDNLQIVWSLKKMLEFLDVFCKKKVNQKKSSGLDVMNWRGEQWKLHV